MHWISNCLWTFASSRDWMSGTLHHHYSSMFVSYVDTESTSAAIKITNNWLHLRCVHAFRHATSYTDIPCIVCSLQCICLPHLIWKDISIFGINQIYLSFHLRPIRRENSHDALLNISHLGLPGAVGKAPCLILKQKPRGWAQLSDQNQPPLRMAVPKYCVLSKYPILTPRWKLIKYPAGGKTSTEKIPL